MAPSWPKGRLFVSEGRLRWQEGAHITLSYGVTWALYGAHVMQYNAHCAFGAGAPFSIGEGLLAAAAPLRIRPWTEWRVATISWSNNCDEYDIPEGIVIFFGEVA